jgi:hypothetical protein
MKIGPLNRWAVVGAVLAVLLVNLQLATSQSQQRVQSTTQLTVRTAVAADPMANWEEAYAEAMSVAKDLQASGSMDAGRRLEKDLKGLDTALREYVRASERLRHKDRAVAQTTGLLVDQNILQKGSHRFQTLSTVAKAVREMESSTTRSIN